MKALPEISVLYEDKHVIAAVKPVGVLSEGSCTAAPDPNAPDIVSLLAERDRKNGIPSPYYAPVHRLDCAVGGVMLLAKKPYAAAELSAVFQNDRAAVKKEYLAAVWGLFDEKEGELRDLLWKDSGKNRVFVVDRMRGGVKEAVLSYRVLSEAETDGKPISLLLVTLGTGRSHQIRAQLSSRAHPILCDGKYGGIRPAGAEHFPGIALWSYHLSAPHPVTLSRTKDGRRPDPDAPRFPDIDVTVLPDRESIPWKLFALPGTEEKPAETD